eukprot:SM000210S06743  [mRNA]  locus=s210:185513:196459:+ [translate_table: standard]
MAGGRSEEARSWEPCVAQSPAVVPEGPSCDIENGTRLLDHEGAAAIHPSFYGMRSSRAEVDQKLNIPLKQRPLSGVGPVPSQAAWLAAAVLLGAAIVYSEGRLRACLDQRVLPQVAASVGHALGREVELGPVVSLSPWHVKLGHTTVGPHEEEFSCGEVRQVEAKSLQRRQLVVDAVLTRPQVLVAQQKDWTWLGIPSQTETSGKKYSTEPGLDKRTRRRRQAREQQFAGLGSKRDAEARRGAQLRYQGSEYEHKEQHDSKSRSEAESAQGKSDQDDAKGQPGSSASSPYEEEAAVMDAVQGDARNEQASRWSPVKFVSELISVVLVQPVAGVLGGLSTTLNVDDNGTSSHEMKERVLDTSAAAALRYFDERVVGVGASSAEGPTDSGLDNGTRSKQAGKQAGGHHGAAERRDELEEQRLQDSQRRDSEKEASTSAHHQSFSLAAESPGRRSSSIRYGNSRSSSVATSSQEQSEGPEDSRILSDRAASDARTSQPLDDSVELLQQALTAAIEERRRKASQAFEEHGRADNIRGFSRATLQEGQSIDSRQNASRIGPPDAHAAQQHKSAWQAGSIGAPEPRHNAGGQASSRRFEAAAQAKGAVLNGDVSALNSAQPALPWQARATGKAHSFRDERRFIKPLGVRIASRARVAASKLAAHAKKKRLEASASGWQPVTVDSVVVKDGTLMLVAYGDHQYRMMERTYCRVGLINNYKRVVVDVVGRLKEWRTDNKDGDGGRLFVKVDSDVSTGKWEVIVGGKRLFAPLFERLLEIPLDWYKGRASGRLRIWAGKEDKFPHMQGRVDCKDLDFSIWEAPSPFMGVKGALIFEGARMFFHDTVGQYGAIPLSVSGDMDLNPSHGEYRLSCQVPGIDANALMQTLGAKPPPLPLAGAVKGVVHCRGPLETPTFEGTAELSSSQTDHTFFGRVTDATKAVHRHKSEGAIAAYDRVPIAAGSASFAFRTDDCVADIYGARITPVGGGEVRGTGELWACPEGELDSGAVNVDATGSSISADALLRFYLPEAPQSSAPSLGKAYGDVTIRGALLAPTVNARWHAPDAGGSLVGSHGMVWIDRTATCVAGRADHFDFDSKIFQSYPPLQPGKKSTKEDGDPDAFLSSKPDITGVDLDLKLKSFDVMDLSPPLSGPANPLSANPAHLRLAGSVKLSTKLPSNAVKQPTGSFPGLSGNGFKLNQLLLGPQLAGTLDLSSTGFKMSTSGKADEHLKAEVDTTIGDALFSLQRGPLQSNLQFRQGQTAKVEIKNLPLDELELASLRGTIEKVDVGLNFQNRKGTGIVEVHRPRFSGLLGESLDVSFRWSGDVVTLEKSVLEQATSRYEIQGEYVLPGIREWFDNSGKQDNEVTHKDTAGHLGALITSMGRWRVCMEVPYAEVAEMLPAARLLSRSRDPAVVLRSKYVRHTGASKEDARASDSATLPALSELRGRWSGTLEASGGGNGDTTAQFDIGGEDWEWGMYQLESVSAAGDYGNNRGLRLERFFIKKDTATLHADGTLMGRNPNLHFAVLNLPAHYIPAFVEAIQSSAATESTPAARSGNASELEPIRGILHMEGDVQGSVKRPQCEVQVRLLDGAVRGVRLGKAEVAASITSGSRLGFHAILELAGGSNGYVRLQGSLPLPQSEMEEDEESAANGAESWEEMQRERERAKQLREKERERRREGEGMRREEQEDREDEGVALQALRALDQDRMEKGAVEIVAAVKDGGMSLLTSISPGITWLQGNADVNLEVRGTMNQPTVSGMASFQKVAISSPVLPRPLSNLGGLIRVKNNQFNVEGLEGKIGRKGVIKMRGQLPLQSGDHLYSADGIELKADALEVRARNMFSGQVDSQLRLLGSLLEPELTGGIQLSRGIAYLSQEKSAAHPSVSASASSSGLGWMGPSSIGKRVGLDVIQLPGFTTTSPAQPSPIEKDVQEDEDEGGLVKMPVAVKLKGLKIAFGPELRMAGSMLVFRLWQSKDIRTEPYFNPAMKVSGELELSGYADPLEVKPRGTLTFENGDVNLVATQVQIMSTSADNRSLPVKLHAEVRLNRDHPNRARFEPEQGLDPTLDLKLVGADWQLKLQGRARSWQDNLVMTSSRSGEEDTLTPTEAARLFESQLADSLLEEDGQLAFKKLAQATVETLMPKIETKGEFGQARWRLVSAPQIPNLLSLDPTTDPFKSLANLSFGTEVEIQFGKNLQASVVRQLKESEMATQWTLLYQLNSKLRLLFSSISPVDNRLLFEYSASSQN